MTKKELIKKLLSSLGKDLIHLGFDQKPKQQSFYRHTTQGWHCFHVGIIEHDSDFDVTIDIAIRFHDVEDLINESTNHLTRSEKSKTCTLGVEIGNLSIGQQKRWRISQESDISVVSDSIIEYHKKYGESYLEKYADMKAAYSLLLPDDKDSELSSPLRASRAKKVIAMAKVLELPEIEAQIEMKKKYLTDNNDFGLSSFLSFANHIES